MSGIDDLRNDLSRLLDEHSLEEEVSARVRTCEVTLRAEAQAAYRTEASELEQRFTAVRRFEGARIRDFVIPMQDILISSRTFRSAEGMRFASHN